MSRSMEKINGFAWYLSLNHSAPDPVNSCNAACCFAYNSAPVSLPKALSPVGSTGKISEFRVSLPSQQISGTMGGFSGYYLHSCMYVYWNDSRSLDESKHVKQLTLTSIEASFTFRWLAPTWKLLEKSYVSWPSTLENNLPCGYPRM